MATAVGLFGGTRILIYWTKASAVGRRSILINSDNGELSRN